MSLRECAFVCVFLFEFVCVCVCVSVSVCVSAGLCFVVCRRLVNEYISLSFGYCQFILNGGKKRL